MIKTIYDIVNEAINNYYDKYDLTDDVQRKRLANILKHEITNGLRTNIEEGQKVDRFLFVEDGSVDTDELRDRLMITNPEIQIIVYRQGSVMPQLIKNED